MIRKLWILEQTQQGHLKIIWIDTDSMVADLLSKSLLCEKFLGMDKFMRGEQSMRMVTKSQVNGDKAEFKEHELYLDLRRRDVEKLYSENDTTRNSGKRPSSDAIRDQA